MPWASATTTTGSPLSSSCAQTEPTSSGVAEATSARVVWRPGSAAVASTSRSARRHAPGTSGRWAAAIAATSAQQKNAARLPAAANSTVAQPRRRIASSTITAPWRTRRSVPMSTPRSRNCPAETRQSATRAPKAQFRQLGADLQTALTQARTKTDAELATELTGLSSRAKQEAAQLAKLDPTPKFKTELKTLSTSLSAVGDDLSQIAAAATKHDAKTAKALTTTLIKDAGARSATRR